VNWRKVFFWSGCGFLLLLLAVTSFLLVADLGSFKPQIERWVTDKTGRHFSIGGEFRVSLGGQIVVVAKDVRLANANWSDNALMLDLRDVELRINTWSLLSGPIQIELIRLEDASIHLELSDRLEPNWSLLETTPGNAGVDWLVEQIDVERLRLVYVSPERMGPLDLRVGRLSQRHRNDDFLELTMQAKIDDREIELQAKVGTWSALLEQKDIDYELQAQLDTLVIVSQGHIDDLIDPRRPSLSFSVKAPDVNDLARLLQIPERGSGNISLTGSLMPGDDGLLVLNVDGNLGRMQTKAAGHFSDLQDLEQVDIDLTLSGPDLGQVLGLFGIHQYAGAAFELSLDAERNGPMVVISKAHASIAQADFDLTGRLPDFPSLNESSLHLEIAGDQFERFRESLQLPGAATGPYSLVFDLNASPDGIEIVRLDIESSLVKINADGKLSDSPGYVGSDFQFDFEIKSLGSIGSAYSIGSFSDRPLYVAGAAVLVEDGLRTRGPVTVHSEDVEATFDGLITLAPGISGSDIAVEFNGPNLSALIREFVAVDHIPAQPYEIKGRLQIRGDEFHFREVTGMLGRSSVEAGGLLNIKNGFTNTEIDFLVSGPAIEELTEAFGNQSFRPGPYALSGEIAVTNDAVIFDDIKLERDRGRLYGDLKLTLPFSELEAEFDIGASGDDLRSVLGSAYGFEADEARFSIDVRGEVHDTLVTLDKLDISVGAARTRANGELDFGEDSRSTRFSFALEIPSLAKLGTFGGHRMREQSLEMNASVTGAGGILLIDDMTARLGDSDVSGTVRLEKGDVPKLTLEVSSDSVRFAPLMEEQQIVYDPAPKLDDGRLIPDIGIPFDWMRSLDFSIKMDIGELQRDAINVTNLKLDSELRDGDFYLHDFEFQTPDGWFRARGSLGPADGSGKATLAATGRSAALGTLLFNTDLGGRSDFDINLQSTGADLRTLAGNLNGIIFTLSTNVVIPQNRFLKRFYGDILNEIVSTVNPFSKSDTVQKLDCIVLPLEITNGAVATKPRAFLQSEKVRMVVDSAINLQTEKLTMQFQTTPRKGFTVSAGEILNPYVKVVGTLAQPRLAVDEKGVLISGGAAVATGGLSILAKAAWRRLSRAKKPCQQAADRSLEMIGDRFPDFSPLIDAPTE
jgi:uncharacterized protein involved in outer membrane biogenesis